MGWYDCYWLADCTVYNATLDARAAETTSGDAADFVEETTTTTGDANADETVAVEDDKADEAEVAGETEAGEAGTWEEYL